jgi:hypothetical protein
MYIDENRRSTESLPPSLLTTSQPNLSRRRRTITPSQPPQNNVLRKDFTKAEHNAVNERQEEVDRE